MPFPIVNSIFNSITYILPVGDGLDCYLVDCGDVEKVIKQGLRVLGVLLTHSHFDHIYGLNKLLETFPNATIYTNPAGQEALSDSKLNISHYHEEPDFILVRSANVHIIDGECVLNLSGDLSAEVFFTPGHDPSCIAYRIGDCLFTGDSYIPGIKVVTTFPRSNKREAAESLARLQRMEQSGLKLMPGHLIPSENV